jgi:two-component system cell cycle sensor histidine kinase PleC
VCIRTLGEHVLSLVGEILDWARLSAGGLELHLTWTPAAELLREGAREAEQKLPREVTLDADPAAGLPQMFCDRARTAQAIGTFTSLVGNFIRRGRISLSARGGDAPGIGPALQIVIEPSAAIPPAEAARALEPFEPWPGDGLGLALPLARRIVELQGGRAEVTADPNAEGQRSAFVLLLPVGQTVHRWAQGRGQARN